MCQDEERTDGNFLAFIMQALAEGRLGSGNRKKAEKKRGQGEGHLSIL